MMPNNPYARMTKPSYLVEEQAKKMREKRKRHQKENRRQKRLNPQRHK